MAKRKVTILGGGMGGIGVAWALTEVPNWSDQFEITLYQMGWRIGGKGASGRNPGVHQRIEEHGLHVWLGFYDNAFAAMKKCYDELGRPEGAPLRTWRDAFHKHRLVVLQEHIDGEWRPWPIDFETNEDEPGTPTNAGIADAWGYVRLLLEWMLGHARDEVAGETPPPDLSEHSWLERAFAGLERDFAGVVHAVKEGAELFEEGMLLAALELARALDEDAGEHDPQHHEALTKLMDQLASHLAERAKSLGSAEDDLRRALLLLEMSTAMVRGMLADGVVVEGFSAVSQWDFREWLGRHGAPEHVVESALTRGLYDLVFAFDGGDPEKPNFEAGAALRSIFSMLFDYKGAIFWKMQAGMGDTVFTPFYEVLRRRGVRFELFHKVENLGLSEDGRLVETVRVQRQVWVKGQREDPSIEYQPLVDVGGLPCWPSAPLTDQLDPEQVAELEKRGIDLESYFNDWQGAETRTLKLGEHFDTVVLAIPPGAHPFICGELIERNERFRSMVENVRTVQTQALQLWLDHDLAGLGWTGGSPVLDAYADSLNTWADMTHLVPHEAWPKSNEPQSIAYFCGPREDAADTPSPEQVASGDTSWFPKRENEQQQTYAIDWALRECAGLWPKIGVSDSFQYDWLITADGGRGRARAEKQYFRANYEPSERYVLSVKGSAQYRLKPGDSGFDNLVLAGDWVDNGFLNAGAIESAVRGALLAAKAITPDAPDIIA